MQQIGRYQILGELGRGGMGIVYLGQDPKIGRRVAIKAVLLKDFSDPEETSWLRERLFREARSAGILSHPNIVTVFDIEEHGETPYIVMEFVKGSTLGATLSSGRVLESSAILSILDQAAEALDYAHQNGVVHRDIKPANIMILDSGAVKIMDFGVAKVTDTQFRTKVGTLMGSPSYMAPEQIQTQAVDGRTDEFSLAAVAYEILTGGRPFDDDSLAIIFYKILHQPPASVSLHNSTLGAQVDAVLQRALAKSAAERYTSCGEFVIALRRALAGVPGWQATPRRRRAAVAEAVQAAATFPTGPTKTMVLTPTPTPSGPSTTVPIVCWKCGATWTGETTLCGQCGARLGREEREIEPVQPLEEVATEPVETGPRPAESTVPVPEQSAGEAVEVGAQSAPAAVTVAKIVQPARRWWGRASIAVYLLSAVVLVGVFVSKNTLQTVPKPSTVPEASKATVPQTDLSASPTMLDRGPLPVAPEPEPTTVQPPSEETPPKTAPAVVKPPKIFRPAGESPPAKQPPLDLPAPSVQPPSSTKPPLPASVTPSITALPPPPVTPPPAPKTEAPKPEIPKPVTSGEIVWEGMLERNQPLIINGRNAAPNGTLRGELPGSPVEIRVVPESVKVIKPPGKDTAYKMMVVHNESDTVSRITIVWSLKQ